MVVSQTEIVAALALLAFAADDREGHDDPVALLEVAVDAGADLDDLAHHLVAHDVAGQHGGNEVVKEMKVGAADGAARHLDDGVARILDLGIGDGVAADIFLSVPNERFHLMAPDRVRAPIDFVTTDVRSCRARKRQERGFVPARALRYEG